jgi:hypothetical protein
MMLVFQMCYVVLACVLYLSTTTYPSPQAGHGPQEDSKWSPERRGGGVFGAYGPNGAL